MPAHFGFQGERLPQHPLAEIENGVTRHGGRGRVLAARNSELKWLKRLNGGKTGTGADRNASMASAIAARVRSRRVSAVAGPADSRLP